MGRYLALIPMALALAACGGGGGGALSLDPVAGAAQRTSKAGSVQFTFTMAGGSSSGRYVSITAQGVTDNADGSTRMSMAFTEAGKTAHAPAVVAGVRTTKYHATVDASRIDKKLPDLGVKHVPVDVWIDHKQMVRKITLKVSAPNPNNSGDFTFVLRGFGPAVTIDAPPSDQTVDIFDLKG